MKSLREGNKNYRINFTFSVFWMLEWPGMVGVSF